MTQGGEEAAEMISTIRVEHVAMKTWFQGQSPEAIALRTKWGDYPSLWKEVLNWKGWKEARRAYMAHQQKSEREGDSRSNVNTNGGTATANANAYSSVKQEPETNGDESTVPRDRKSTRLNSSHVD